MTRCLPRSSEPAGAGEGEGEAALARAIFRRALQDLGGSRVRSGSADRADDWQADARRWLEGGSGSSFEFWSRVAGVSPEFARRAL